MSKLSAIKLQLSKLLASFREIKTDKNILSYPEDIEPKVGLEVYVADENGEFIPAPDDEYAMEDGRVIVVVEGKIAEIREAAPAIEEPVEMEEEPAEPAAPAEEPAPAAEEPAMAELEEKFNELADIVAKLVEKVAEMEAKNAAAEEVIEKMSKMSAAKPAEIEIEDKPAMKTGNQKLDDKLNKMFKK